MSHGRLHVARLLGLCAVILLMLAACTEPEGEEEESTPTVTPGRVTETPATPPATPTPDRTTPGSSITPEVVRPTPVAPQARVYPEFMPLLEDIVMVDLKTRRLVFEVDVQQEFGNNPRATLVSEDSSMTVEEVLSSNMEWLAQQGYSAIEVPVATGTGTLLYASKVLLAKTHPGFDYDSQYLGDPAEEELAVSSEKAKQKYNVLEGVFPQVLKEAHARGIKVFANIESLAHIINRAEGSGVGGSGETLQIAGNLPPPTVDDVLKVIDELLALGADAVSAEAYSEKYDAAIAQHLEASGVQYKHSGADLGSLWAGYYYSLYPDNPRAAEVYQYVYTSDSVIGTTSTTIFGRARALSERPSLAVVVGAYNPVPCDTNLSISDLYSTSRGGDELPIDQDDPRLADGSPVETCATQMWPNLVLLAVRTQDVDVVELTADLTPSVDAVSNPALVQTIKQRLDAHPAIAQDKPIANIIVDMPQYGPEDWLDALDFFSFIMEPLLGSIGDALSAAGYTTILTYDRPWEGGQSDLTYIVTAGGNETTEGQGNMGPPYWLSALELEPGLVKLLDPAVHPGPVFVHPIFGVPDLANWKEVREQFGLPERFAYKNSSLARDEMYQTSLLSSLPTTPEGDPIEDAPHRYLTPDTGEVLGKTMHLLPYGDTTSMGQTANLAQEGEVPPGQVVVAGPLHISGPDGATAQVIAPYLVTDGQGRFLWLINHLHHEALTYLVGQAISQVTGRPPVLAEPARAHVWSGRQTFALAYDKTEVALNLPFADGEAISITVYDVRSEVSRRELSIAYHAPLRVSLDKYSLLVVEPSP